MIETKRAYEPASKEDGERILVERLWPRGVKKGELRLDRWIKDIAPSTALRQWFQHDTAKWSEFRRRYFRELERHEEIWEPLLGLARRGRVTLVYSAHDTEHNNAVALQEFLKSKAKPRKASNKAD